MVFTKDLDEKKHGFDVLLNHLEEYPNKVKKKFLKNIDICIKNIDICIMRLDIKKVTGKASE
jgi:nitroimidazol reductase NimA-like FMN-containing flavoprotein (pyridoxamine 5'-phosphate oxidase superfamily)